MSKAVEVIKTFKLIGKVLIDIMCFLLFFCMSFIGGYILKRRLLMLGFITNDTPFVMELDFFFAFIILGLFYWVLFYIKKTSKRA